MSSSGRPNRKKARVETPETLDFVVFDKKGRFSVNPAAARFLESLGPLPLAPVALAGPYRHGKSFLLNRVILQNDPGTGFTVGQTVNACTKGLHLSTKILPASNSSDGDYGILVIDTEGLGAMTATDSHDARIFSLALLLSSMFMYNSKGTIDQPAINNLSLVANISKHIQCGKDYLSSFLPSFLWVVRDFALDLVDEHGQEIDQKDYLEQALRPVPDAPEEKNRVRASLCNYFKHRDCIVMSRPADDESVLKNLNAQPNDALKAEFMAQAKGLRDKMVVQARPKQACGTALTGKLLVRLATVYCDAINSGAAPAIQDSWTLISKDECSKAVEAAIRAFDEHLAANKADGSAVDADGSQAVVPSSTLEQLFTAGFEVALSVYKDKAIGAAVEEQKTKLREALRVSSARIRASNMQVVSRRAQAACSTLDERLLDQPSFEDVRSLYHSLETDFVKQVGADSGTKAAWTEQAAARVWDWASRYHAELNSRVVETTVRLEALQKEQMRDAATLQQSKEDIKRLQGEVHAGTDRVAVLTAELEDARRSAEARREEMQAQLEETDAVEEKLRAQYALLQEELTSAITARDSAVRDLASESARLAEANEALATHESASAEATAELLHLRKAVSEHAETVQKLDALGLDNAALRRQIDDLTARMDQEADHHRAEIKALHGESKKTIQQLQATREGAEQRLRDAVVQKEAATKELAALKKQHAQRAEQTANEIKRLQSECQRHETQRDADREEARRELGELRTTLSDNAKRFQQQLDENAAQHREEARRRAAKQREEQERLFQEKVTAIGRAQTAESRAAQAEESLKETREALSRERDKVRKENNAGKIAELENKLASAVTRAELMATTASDKADQIGEQQGRITELEAELRQIEQKHEAEKMRMELEFARKLSHG